MHCVGFGEYAEMMLKTWLKCGCIFVGKAIALRWLSCSWVGAS